MDELTQAISSLVETAFKTQMPVAIQLCKVSNVDTNQHTINCESLIDSTKYTGVRLIAREASKGIVFYPKLNSFVVVALLHNNPSEVVVVMQSEIDNISIDLEGQATATINADGTAKIKLSKLEIEFDELVMNGGNLGAIPKLPVLQTEVGKNSQLLEALKASLQAAPITPADGGASFKAALVAALSPMQTANLSQAGNPKIKQ